MAQSESNYIKLKDTYKVLKEELSIPRCINCDNNNGGYCVKFKQMIPEQSKYVYTDCKFWLSQIPF
jgi:hypothetical protein